MKITKKIRIAERTNIITLRLTDSELELLNDNAKRLRFTRSEYLRELLLNHPIEFKYEVVADIEELKLLTSEYGRIGNNLNQIAKYFNTGGDRSLAMEDEIHECISQLFILRKQVLRMAGEFHGSNKTHR